MSEEMIEYFRDNNLAYDKDYEKKIDKKIDTNEKRIDSLTASIAKKQEAVDDPKTKAAAAATLRTEITKLELEIDELEAENDVIRVTDRNKLSFDKDAWEVAITSLQGHLDTLGINTQQLMIFVNDYMGQYNSYLQGANSVIQQSSQTLAELARVR